MATPEQVPLPPDPVSPEIAIAQGKREQIEISQGQLRQLSMISHLLGTQNAQTSLNRYGGDPKKFQQWVRSLEKHALLAGVSDGEGMKALALQSSEGPVSDFLVRYLKNETTCSWEGVLTQLKARFADIVDSQHGLQVLRATKQKSGEAVQIYAEHLLCVAEQAWPDQSLNQPLIQRQLIDIFIDGLRDTTIARKVLREDPNSLNQAVQISVTEQILAKKFELRNRGFRSQ